MDPKLETRISKLLSLVLRHEPQHIGIELDEHGWTDIHVLIERMNACGLEVNMEIICQVVRNNAKQRFSINESSTRIRANQGHSIAVDLELKPQLPPDTLYHGTATRFVDTILKEGIMKRSRQFVHLSTDLDTAISVGARHGKPVVLVVDAAAMAEAGIPFFKSENGVWLVDEVDSKYLSIHS